MCGGVKCGVCGGIVRGRQVWSVWRDSEGEAGVECVAG